MALPLIICLERSWGVEELIPYLVFHVTKLLTNMSTVGMLRESRPPQIVLPLRLGHVWVPGSFIKSVVTLCIPGPFRA